MEENKMKSVHELIKKAKEEWNEDWIPSMITYEREYNEYTVWVGRTDIYKAFFDADTLECVGTKC
jgi:hypothetical protein